MGKKPVVEYTPPSLFTAAASAVIPQLANHELAHRKWGERW
jgi:hypothetical protein